MLSVLSTYIPSIPPVTVDGIYGSATRAAVLAAQRRFRLPETGTVGAQTWDAIYDQYSGIENTALRNQERFPVPGLNTNDARQVAVVRRNTAASNQNRANYASTTILTQFPGQDLTIGSQDPIRQEVVR